MVRLSPTAVVIGLIALLLASAITATAQEPVVITVGNITVESCSGRLTIPIFMDNPYPVGGFNFWVRCTSPDWLSFTIGNDIATNYTNWDTIGSRVSDWDLVNTNVLSGEPGTIRTTAISDILGGNTYLTPGEGLIMNFHPHLGFDFCADTSQLIVIDSVHVSDTTGYHLLNVEIESDSVYLLAGPCANSPRGDANCSGILNGIDVVFLVAYFKGLGDSYCCLCTGDANDNGSVNGIDITYLVSYFKGTVDPPAPCH